mmetsp:Transcript_22444/g.51417  ORF Transcript_22444/g.51417 Transcript_22444/m.51417 type:complete len:120 (+) Transcript_22444:102-461(+)
MRKHFVVTVALLFLIPFVGAFHPQHNTAGDYDQEAVRKRLDGMIAASADGVLMLSFSRCPFCMKAKSILRSKGAAFKVVELDTDVDGKVTNGVAWVLFYPSIVCILILRLFALCALPLI